MHIRIDTEPGCHEIDNQDTGCNCPLPAILWDQEITYLLG